MNCQSILKNCCHFLLTSIILFISYLVTGQDVIEIQYTKYTCVYKIIDECKIRADVYCLPGEKIRPAIIYVHGGALIMGSRKGIPVEELEGYLNAGFSVISIDYRLAPETKLTGIIEDLEDAYNWIRKKGPDLFRIDPDNIAVVGHSAGGYLTLMTGFRLKPSPKVLVSYYGYGNITGDWYSKPDFFYNQSPTVSKDQALAAVGDSVISEPGTLNRRQFYLYCRQQGFWPEEVCGHDPEKEYAWYSDYEPLRNVTPAYPPTILLHGEMDTDVPFEQSVLMAEMLKFHGVDHVFITNPEWGHVFDRDWWDPDVQKSFNQVLKFLIKHIEIN